MIDTNRCRVCHSPLIKKETKRTAAQLTKPYYYTAYYFCPNCKRLYHDDAFKVMNSNFTLFTSDGLSDKKIDIEIWTDGACVNNGKINAKAAWAFVAGEYEQAGEVDGKQTNNRAEALALYHGLMWAAEKGFKRIKVYTDSQITLHGIVKDPNTIKANGDIFKRIKDTIVNHHLDVAYEKVLGHSGIENNERADKLATELAGKS